MRIALVIVDSLRADTPGFAGGGAATPTLDRLARAGRTFSTSLSSAPWTVPAISALVTGTYAHRLGLYRWEQPLPPGAPSLFHALLAAGYRVASFVFDPAYLFSAAPEAGVVGPSQDPASVTDWIARATDERLFVLVHYWGTHFPYLDRPMTTAQWAHVSEEVLAAMRADPAAVVPKVRALYERAASRMSELFLPRLAEAVAAHAGAGGHLVLLTADHGESWGERKGGSALGSVLDLHGAHLHEEALRTPLVAWGPTWLRPGVSAGLARSVDVAPTIAALAEAAGPPPAWDGRSLVGCLARGDDAPAAEALAAASRDFTQGTPPATPAELWRQLALRTGRWKLLCGPDGAGRVAFDLLADPAERRPLEPAQAEGTGELWARLGQACREARCAPPGDPVASRLRGLGYLD